MYQKFQLAKNDNKTFRMFRLLLYFVLKVETFFSLVIDLGNSSQPQVSYWTMFQDVLYQRSSSIMDHQKLASFDEIP